MLGAIIGDIAGSTYEVDEITEKKKKSKVSYEKRIEILDKKVPLFKEGSLCTDDTILTCAIADCILNNSSDYESFIKKYAIEAINEKKEINGMSRFSSSFTKWVYNNEQGTKNTNGCAMRISPIPIYYDDFDKILNESYLSIIPSHNNPESIKYGKLLSKVIYMAKNKLPKESIKDTLKDCGYDIDFNLEDLQRNNTFIFSAKETVMHAIFCFLESTDFENSIRLAISIGGDTDTIAAMTGGISECYYGIPKEIKDDAFKIIPDKYKKIINKFYYTKELNDFLNFTKMNDELFINYTKKQIHRIDSCSDKAWYGCFPILDDDNLIKDYNLIIPKLETEEDLLVNIHEYTHAFDLYNNIGNKYSDEKEDINKLEENAVNNEKKYLIKKKGKK